jgi:hypothetical protein
VGVGTALGRTRSSGDNQRWTELATPHFVISTDLPEARARSIAQSLEEMRAALLPDLTPDGLDQQLLAYSQSGRFVEVEADVVPTVFEPKLRVLSPAPVRGLQATLASSLDNSLRQTEMLEALRLDPNELNALIVRFHSLGESLTQARSDIAARAVAAHPGKGDAWLLQAGPRRRGTKGARHSTELCRSRRIIRAWRCCSRKIYFSAASPSRRSSICAWPCAVRRSRRTC